MQIDAITLLFAEIIPFAIDFISSFLHQQFETEK
jgi:hypothetical protein